MPRSILYLLIGVLLYIAQPAYSQSLSDTQWYWARLPEKKQLVAYSVDGTVNVLLNNVETFLLRRIDQQTAVVMGKTGDEYNAYIVTPTSATLVSMLYKENDIAEIPRRTSGWLPPGVEGARLADNNILIWSEELEKVFLFDEATRQTTELKLGTLAELRLSSDEQYVRYRIEEKAQNSREIRWTLYEYNVLTGTTRDVYQRNITVLPTDISGIERCLPDDEGARWYCTLTYGRYEDSAPAFDTAIIRLDGKEQPLPDNFHIKEALNGDWYFIASDQYYFPWPAGCSFQLFSAEGILLHTFTVPDTLRQETDLNLVYSSVLDSKRIAITDSFSTGRAYILSADGKLTYLGDVPCAPCLPPSSDGRWRILYNLSVKEQPKTQVWDLQHQVMVLECEGFCDYFGYIDGGIVVNYRYYSFIDARVYQPNIPSLFGTFFQILPDGVLLYRQSYEQDNHPPGIYRYTPEDGSALLIEGGEPIESSDEPPAV